MIVILTRDDVPGAHSHRPVESLKLYHMRLPVDTIQKADMIVFVEGEKVKFLKHFPEIQSKDSFDVLLRYITSTPPIDKEPIRFSKKLVIRRKKVK